MVTIYMNISKRHVNHGASTHCQTLKIYTDRCYNIKCIFEFLASSINSCAHCSKSRPILIKTSALLSFTMKLGFGSILWGSTYPFVMLSTSTLFPSIYSAIDLRSVDVVKTFNFLAYALLELSRTKNRKTGVLNLITNCCFYSFNIYILHIYLFSVF